ncbi:uncharacterized protein LOC115232954 [Formica exsecta]|uniref:uncharacterized protein LOC115232954 n=1 Tax=Formica exsecta TaxID=72781 RepID=UPI001144397F|nr:uncharacterized protein LOC115232954 [Formica exsecta]
MADDEVKEILRNLDLEILIDTFTKERINIKALKNLTIPMINELIQTIGDRAIFIEYWQRNFSRPLISSENKEKDAQPTFKKRKLDYENTDADLITTTSNIEKENELKRENCFVGKSEFIKNTFLSIKEILSKQKLGLRIITAYEKQKNFTEAQRNKICDIVLTYIDERFSELPNDIAKYVAEKICETFPTEVVKTYYISPIKKKNAIDNKSKASKEKVVESMKWLEANGAPWIEVLLHWSTTKKRSVQ